LRNSDLDNYNGVPKGPGAVTRRMVDLGRQTGKTWAMVRALPDDGRAIIVVHRMVMKEHIMQMIRDMRGRDYPIKKLTFVTYQDFPNSRIRGLGPRPVYVDNCVLDILVLDYVEQLNKMLNPVDPQGRNAEEDTEFWKTVAAMAKELPRFDY
jgi:hypothetical protein